MSEVPLYGEVTPVILHGAVSPERGPAVQGYLAHKTPPPLPSLGLCKTHTLVPNPPNHNRSTPSARSPSLSDILDGCRSWRDPRRLFDHVIVNEVRRV